MVADHQHLWSSLHQTDQHRHETQQLTSRCSSSVLLVYGRVGLVEEGSTLSFPQTTIISGACPPPAPSVWYLAASTLSTWVQGPVLGCARVYHPALESIDGVFNEARLVECVRVDVALRGRYLSVAFPPRTQILTWTSYLSQTLRHASMAAGVLPQS